MNRNDRLAIVATVLALPGAAAQAGNNMAAAVLKQQLVAAEGGLSGSQVLSMSLCVAFGAVLIASLLVQQAWRRTDRRFSFRPARGAYKWHLARLGLGLSATGLIFWASAQALDSKTVSVGLVTLLISTPPILLAGVEALTGVYSALPVAAIGFAGIGVASWTSITDATGVSPAVPAALVAGVLLALLQLVQKKLSRDFFEPTAKVTGIFGAHAFALSATLLIATSVDTGVWPSLSSGVLWSGAALMACYAATQLLLQFANGYGRVAIVAVVVYAQLPFGFIYDAVLTGRFPTGMQVTGSLLIVAAAMIGLFLEDRRMRRLRR